MKVEIVHLLDQKVKSFSFCQLYKLASCLELFNLWPIVPNFSICLRWLTLQSTSWLSNLTGCWTISISTSAWKNEIECSLQMTHNVLDEPINALNSLGMSPTSSIKYTKTLEHSYTIAIRSGSPGKLSSYWLSLAYICEHQQPWNVDNLDEFLQI